MLVEATSLPAALTRRGRRRARVIAASEALRHRAATRRGMWIELFAGGGGWGVGAEMATGRSMDVAINHDAPALAMYQLNHPDTKVLTADVFEVDPREACAGGAWCEYLHASPDCTDHSKAKGGKPLRTRKRRALAWVMIYWAGTVRPSILTFENVEEWYAWGGTCAKRDRCRCKKKPKGGPRSTRRGACMKCGATGRVLKWDPCRCVRPKKGACAACGATGQTVAAPGEVVPVAKQMLVRDPRKAGETRRRFVRELEILGYTVSFQERRAYKAGAPTIRRRLYMIARCDGLPATWPAPSHGDPKTDGVKAGRLKPWRTAADCIDFSEPTFSIFGTREEAKDWAKRHGRSVPQRPLADPTLRRTARGVMKYVVNNPRPFIVGVGGRMGQSQERGADAPFQTVTGKADSSVVQPVLAPLVVANNMNNRPHAVTEPVPTVTGGGRLIAAEAHLAPWIQRDFGASVGHRADHPTGVATAGGGGKMAVVAPVLAHLTHHGDQRAHPADGLCPTVTGAQRGEIGLIAPVLADVAHGEVSPDGSVKRWGAGAHSVEAPSGSVLGSGNPALVTGFLVPRYGERDGQEPRCISLETPSPVVVPTGNGGGLAAVHLATYHADKRPGDLRGSSVTEPADAVDTSNRHAVIAAYLAQQHNGGFYDVAGGAGRPLDAPAGAVCAEGSPQGLTAAALLKLKGTSHDGDPAAPLDTVAAGGRHRGLAAIHLAEMADAEWAAWLIETYPHATKVYGFLQKYYGAEVGQYHGLDEPVHTIPTVDRYGLVLVTVVVDGVRMVIVDIAMRMLQPRELFNAQGFPRSYLINVNFFDKQRGKRRWLTKTEQVRMRGNSVPPPEATAIVGANVPRSSWELEAAA